MAELTVLVACGAAVATGIVAAEKISAAIKERGLKVTVRECKISEVPSLCRQLEPVAVVTTGPLHEDLPTPNTRKYLGLPLITGIGADDLLDDLCNYLAEVVEQSD